MLPRLFLLGFLALALLYPLGRVLALGLGQGLGEVLANPYYWGRYLWSLKYGVLSASLSLLLALPLAFLLRGLRGREVFLGLATLPFVLPTPVVALGFLSLSRALGLGLYGTEGVLLWGAVFYNLGLALRVVFPVALGLGEALAAARTLGATPLRAFLRVALPLLGPAALSAWALVFIYTFSAFGVPLLLGGGRYATLEVEVYLLLAHRLAFAEAAGLILLQLLTLALAALLYLLFRPAPLAYAYPLEPLRGAWTLGLGLFWTLLYAPFLGLFLGLDPKALASAWTSEAFTPLPLALRHSLGFALLGLALALPLGLAYAWSARKSPFWDLLGLLPLMVSPVALGFGYLLAYPGLRGSLFLLVLAYALLAYPLVARPLLPALRSLPPSLLEAARTLGATPLRAFLRVELPFLRPALASGLALGLASLLGEFGASLVLWRPEWTTLTLAIYERLGRPGEGPFREAQALALVLALLAGGGFYLLDRGRSRY